MGTLERELADLMEQIRHARIAADAGVEAALAERKQQLCSLLAVLG